MAMDVKMVATDRDLLRLREPESPRPERYTQTVLMAGTEVTVTVRNHEISYLIRQLRHATMITRTRGTSTLQ